MSFAFGVPLAMLLFLLMSFRFLALILVAFLVGTISCFVSKFSTVSTASFECFLVPFFVGGTCKEGIIILLFFQPLACFIAKYLSSRTCSISGISTVPFLSLSFMTSMAPSYSVYSREFNKCVINVSSSIMCPVFISSARFFSMKVIQSMGLCLLFSSL